MMVDDQDIRAKVGSALDKADPDKVQRIVDDILDMTKGKWAVVDFTCKKCEHTAQYKAMVQTPDYQARANALAKLIEASDKPAKPLQQAPEVTQAQIDEMVKVALEKMLGADMTDEQLARLAA